MAGWAFFWIFRQFSYSLNEENEMQLTQYQRGSSGKNIMRNIFCCAVVVVCSPFFPLWRTNLCFASVDHCRHHTSSWSSQHQFKFVWETNCMLHSHNGLLYSFFSISLALFKLIFCLPRYAFCMVNLNGLFKFSFFIYSFLRA